MQIRVTADAELCAAPDRLTALVASLLAGTVVERAGIRNHRWMPVHHGVASGWVAVCLLESISEPGPNGGQPTEAGIIEIIREAARTVGQPKEDLLRVGHCESILDPRAVNPGGPYFGLFQFV